MRLLLALCSTLSLLLWPEITTATRPLETIDIPSEYVITARCEAFCRNKYADASEIRAYNNREIVTSESCSRPSCEQCLTTCRQDLSAVEDCQLFCQGDEACLESCEFTTSLQNSSAAAIYDDRHITDPMIVCKNLPYSKNDSCKERRASIYIKWDIGEVGTDDVIIYIVSTRSRQSETETGSQWSVVKIVPYTFLEMDGLSCDTFYQFAVTMVTQKGLLSYTRTSPWSKTLKHQDKPPNPPISMSVVDVSTVKWSPSAMATWQTDEDASCYYKIYWLSSVLEEREIKTPRDFSYTMRNLMFSTNYSIHLYAYDDMFQRSSDTIHQNFLTPECLPSTQYNYSVCGPLEPENITVDVLTKNYKDRHVRYVNITLSWLPPRKTHKGTDVLKYYVEYIKEPLIPPNALVMTKDAGSFIVNTTSVVIQKIHNHNHYSFNVKANTKGGNSSARTHLEYIGADPNSFLGSKSTGPPTPISNELVAIVLSCAMLILVPLIIVFVILLRRRSSNKDEISPRRFGPIEEMNPIYERVSPLDFQHKLLPDDYEIDYSRLDFISVIGEGAFGKVVKAEYRLPSENGEIKPPQIVAVKMLKEFYTGDESRNFLLEIQAMKNLGNHPYIVSIIGSCMTGPKLCLVMDYCALGDLRNYLRKYREKMMYNITSSYGMMSKPDECDLEIPLLNHTNTNLALSTDNNKNTNLSTGGDGQIELTEGQLLSYARQITMGMEFLEERKFIHRDLAARNILLCDPKHLKISDFGLTRDVYETNVYQPTSARKLPYKWMAIESLFSQRFTIKSDVWSFGIVLWEIVTLGGSPYPSIPLKDLYGLLKDGYRMEKPDNCSPKLFQIMLACWHPNPNCRPAFSQLRLRLEKLLEETQSYIDLSIEVSNDYFNESTSGSHPPQYPNSHGESQISSGELTPSELSHLASSKELYVDIQDGAEDTNQPTSDVADSQNNDATTVTCSDSQIYLASCENCSFHMENNKLLNSVNSTDNGDLSKQCPCVLCVNKARMDSRNSQLPESTSKVRGSVKSSLKNIIDKVSARASDNISRHKKRSVSLTDVYNVERRYESQM